jgi:hypothetical protein
LPLSEALGLQGITLLHLSPKTYGLVYFFYIPVFGILYYWLPTIDCNGSWRDSLYFSVVTLSTLGYGEITPKSDLAKLAVSVQTLLGILTIGLFLNALAELRSKLEFQRVSENNTRILERHVCLLLEQMESVNPFGWDKHAIHAKSYDDISEFIDSLYLGILDESHKLTELQIKMFLQAVDQHHDTILGLIPIAANISSDIGNQWISLVSNVRNLTQQYKFYVENDNEAIPSQNDIALQVEELINSFYIICLKDRPNKKINKD